MLPENNIPDKLVVLLRAIKHGRRRLDGSFHIEKSRPAQRLGRTFRVLEQPRLAKS